MTMLKMSELDLTGKRVCIREDFNVPIEKGKMSSDSRIQAALPTIKQALDKNAAVILLSHLGRPKTDGDQVSLSLKPVAECLSAHLQQPVTFVENWLDGITIKPGEVALCENVRFNAGEMANDANLAKKMAALCDIFVMDAFASAHRAQASTTGIAQYATIACAGPLLLAEVTALTKALERPARPMLAIVGGAKVSDKLHLLRALANKVDQLILGGGIANTFLAAAGHSVGKSLCEADLVATAKDIMQLVVGKGGEIPLPLDVVVAKELSEKAQGVVKAITDVAADDLILDIGPKTVTQYEQFCNQAKTILWNGPLGVFEIAAFANGTERLARAIAASQAYSLAGGGDTLAAIEKFHLSQNISYISTGGGAFLSFVEGRTLPAIAMLQERFTNCIGV